MEILGYVVGLIVGVILGMFGGGGSLLVPAMLYLLKLEPSFATAYTTVLVGITSLFGVFPRIRTRQIDWWTVLSLGVPVSLGMLMTRVWLFDVIPDVLFQIGDLKITKRSCVLTITAGILLISFGTMVGLIGRNLKPRTEMREQRPVLYYLILTISGLLIGVIPGLTGAGGGVLIVPLLVVFFGTPIKTVIGTSLAIVAAKSLIGFSGDVIRIGPQIDWFFLVGFGAVMIVGVQVGSHLATRIGAEKLKLGFAWFMFVLAIFILVKEFVIF